MPYQFLQVYLISSTSTSSNAKIKSGNILLTTNRVLFYIGTDCLEVPLHNVGRVESLGGIFAKDGVKLHLQRHGELSPNVVDFYQNILRRQDLPQPPQFGSAIELRFHDKTRDRFLELLNEAHRERRWTQRIVTESMQQAQAAQMIAPPEEPGRVYGGIGAVKARKENQTAYTQA